MPSFVTHECTGEREACSFEAPPSEKPAGLQVAKIWSMGIFPQPIPLSSLPLLSYNLFAGAAHAHTSHV